MLLLEKNPVKRLHWEAFSSQRGCVWQLNQFLVARKERPGLNRIVHPDWVKLSVELNLHAKPKYEISLHYSFFPVFSFSIFLMCWIFHFFLEFPSFLRCVSQSLLHFRVLFLFQFCFFFSSVTRFFFLFFSCSFFFLSSSFPTFLSIYPFFFLSLSLIAQC